MISASTIIHVTSCSYVTGFFNETFLFFPVIKIFVATSLLGFEVVQSEPVGRPHDVQDKVVPLGQRSLVRVDPLQHLHADVGADVGPVYTGGERQLRGQDRGQQQAANVTSRRGENRQEAGGP